MKAISVARVPPAVRPTTLVTEASPKLDIDSGCAVAIVDEGRLIGPLSKADVIRRVVEAGLDPAATTVGEIMTTPPVTVTADAETEDALKLMRASRQCFLPVVDDRGDLKAWLTICGLFDEEVDTLSEQIGTLANWIGADGPGG